MFTPEAYFEVKEQTSFEVSIADLFDYTIFPVPHVEDDRFSINMVAATSMAVKYSLLDSQGQLLYSSKYNLP